ncbi:ABC transporter permease [Pelagicoccus sp. SDUM812002]|uniref:ABC transporter permease n=1 Tax=Pelagicoccus sp. SDUM812002 TaxID=3041266 RepID=UPI00280D4584|nr:ABC transporter permease [Pelagicoccus sp. SDUM812002]MDQ8187980.1 ABC transporter permease [Pelagicoccus sp. SDUM812002]
MLRFFLIRLGQSIPTLLAIYTITFFMVRSAPGGPFSQERKVAPHIIEAQMEYYGFNDPVYVQYFRSLEQHLTFDFPPLTSYPGLTAGDIIGESFPVSLELGIWALLVALLFGIPTGVLAATKQNTAADYAPMSMAMLGICLPTFVIGPLLALFFGVWLGWFKVSGWFDLSDRILPALTLGLFYAAYVARLTRVGMLEVLGMDYVRTARAKGLPERIVVLKHALRGGVMPVVSFLGPALAGLVSGSFVVETIFQVPGLGRHFVQAALSRDHSLVLSTVLFYAALIILANVAVDAAQILLNPKLRKR